LKRLGGVEGERGGTRLKKPAAAKRRSQRKTLDGSRAPTLHQQLDQRNRELRELQEQQAATSKVLEVISSSRGDLAPVFRTVLENAVRVCGAKFGNLWLRDGDFFRIGAMHGAPPDYVELHRREPLTRPVPGTALARAALTRKAVQIADVRKVKGYGGSGSLHVGPIKLAGARTVFAVPMLKDDELIGVIIVYRQEVHPFTDKQIELVKNFAAQAAIAIENARLLNELKNRTDDLSKSLQQQTATADVLKVISRSAFDLQTVLDTLVQSAAQLCSAEMVNIWRPGGGGFQLAAGYAVSGKRREARENREYLESLTIEPGRGSVVGRTLIEGRVTQVADLQNDAEYHLHGVLKLGSYRTALGVPLMREGTPIGVLFLTRTRVEPFTAQQIALVESFADQAVIAIENVRLFNETSEALEQQTATSKILQVISNSPTNTQPVFDTIVQSALNLFSDAAVSLALVDGDQVKAAAINENDPVRADVWRKKFPVPLTRNYVNSAAILDAKVVDIPDVRKAPPQFVLGAKNFDDTGYRAVTSVPMMRGDVAIGCLSIMRTQPGPLSDKQLALVKTFANQAVIAIENTRLFTELRQRTDDLSESLQQQTATADVLKVISRSTFDLQTVLDTLVESATRLCEADYAWVFQREGNHLHWVASYGNDPDTRAMIRDYFKPLEVPMDRGSVTGRAALEAKAVHVADVLADPDYTWSGPQKIAGYRAALGVPLLRQDDIVGVIFVGKTRPEPFAEKQIELVTTFADQAVIAIENTRLLNELRDSLEQQTATADVLKVISRSAFDLHAVLDTLTESAAKLCDADMAGIVRPRDGQHYWATDYKFPSAFMDYVKTRPILADRGSVAGRALLERGVVHIVDVLADPEFTFGEAQKRGNYRTVLAIPLLREGTPVGVIVLTRIAVRPFTDKQVEVLRTFADQAVIAIENARLFDEVQARTAELSEALDQQTATSDVLSVISSSPGELKPVFHAMLENATRICQAKFGTMFLYDGTAFQYAADVGAPREYTDFQSKRGSFQTTPGSQLDQVLRTKKVTHTADYAAESVVGVSGRLGGARSSVCVPMLKDDALIGAILIYRQEVPPFADKQIALLENFAAQAVIAIENTRLLSELRHSLDQQTATADVLKVISRSAFDVQSVLDTLVESAGRLCQAENVQIFLRDEEGVFRLTAHNGFSLEYQEYLKANPIRPGRGTLVARTADEVAPVHIPDVLADAEYTWHEGQKLAGFRAMLGVPLLREGNCIGVMCMTKSVPQPFTEKQIEIISTFADQAVIAIENARLFNEVQARTAELTKSLENLRTAQDRLVQTEKLASLGQLTAGIAHEIKNPLNFVNNFSALSTELIDEIKEVLEIVKLDEKTGTQLTELMDMLQGNLEKVVQHGKRADSIVKNMLLHSRHGSGEHRSVDINAVVEESLNLAYHGARAEKQGFNITLQRSFDPTAGEADLFPQEITRVLLNLISNGFYAATKRKAQIGAGGHEPMLAASTKNLGDSVEIRIRDNGNGIPPEVREKMFNPFFTTKPAGEGTGLGLSISHDIIVKQHGGSIDVDTAPGEYTEFCITLPRKAAILAKTGAPA
jgi:GAF domain-containing protein